MDFCQYSLRIGVINLRTISRKISFVNIQPFFFSRSEAASGANLVLVLVLALLNPRGLSGVGAC